MTARQAWRAVGRAAAGLLALLLGFTLVFPPLYARVARDDRPAVAPPPPVGPGPFTVYVVDWGYHTAVVVPQPAGWRLGPPGAEGAPYVEYAWGDRRFYRDSDYRPWSVFAAAALPTASVIYVAGRAAPPSEASGARAVYARAVDGRTLGALAAELERSVRHSPNGARVAPAPAAAGYAGRFYDAYGAYLWAADCNAWTVARLAAVGLARPGAGGPGAGVVFAGQVGGRLAGFARAPTPRPPNAP